MTLLRKYVEKMLGSIFKNNIHICKTLVKLHTMEIHKMSKRVIQKRLLISNMTGQNTCDRTQDTGVSSQYTYDK